MRQREQNRDEWLRVSGDGLVPMSRILMREEEIATNESLGLKMYRLADDNVSGWVVTGPSAKVGKRWRRVFSTLDLARDFFIREVDRLGGEHAEPITSKQHLGGIVLAGQLLLLSRPTITLTTATSIVLPAL